MHLEWPCKLAAPRRGRSPGRADQERHPQQLRRQGLAVREPPVSLAEGLAVVRSQHEGGRLRETSLRQPLEQLPERPVQVAHLAAVGGAVAGGGLLLPQRLVARNLPTAPVVLPKGQRSGQRTLAGAGDDIRLRFDNGACPTAAPAAPASPAAAKTSWIGRWLGRAGSSQPWRIRL